MLYSVRISKTEEKEPDDYLDKSEVMTIDINKGEIFGYAEIYKY